MKGTKLWVECECRTANVEFAWAEAIRSPVLLLLPCASHPDRQCCTLLSLKHCRWSESRSPLVPSLRFPSSKSKGEETSLTWVLSLQMFPENVTFHFGPPELPWLLAQLYHPLKHRVQRNCKALWCPYRPTDLHLYLAKVIASVKWLFIPQTLFLQ